MSGFDNLIFNNSEENFINKKRSIVHIRILQRGKKKVSVIQGLAKDLDLKKILKALKKTYKTNGGIRDDENGDKIIKIFGDKRKEIKDFLSLTNIIEKDKDEIYIHG